VEPCQSHSLKDLLPTDVLHSAIQILDLLYNIVHLALVRTLNRACLSNSQVQCEPDAIRRSAAAQPSSTSTGIAEAEAKTMISRICSCEGEFAF